ncbi:hypothetical protein [Luteibaculum oceani]|uniref:DUF4258 domain-containing protein n=1 Tax=Luteibaculum oceani TaxID=1294296 RepID=A0A5C6UY87_9FLAO|nr:hypothetical protein [Luteibaculum oceani]TXC78372.1 hypothetical protein FRX97_08560 [Luteibaculum oceani]
MNSTFFKRLRLYLIGVLIGAVMVVFIFKERTSLLTSWLPENTVIEAIQTSDFQLNATDSCYFNCLGANEDLKAFFDEADVLFSEGERGVKDANRYYILKNDDKSLERLRVTFVNDSLVSFSSWKLMEGKNCPC